MGSLSIYATLRAHTICQTDLEERYSFERFGIARLASACICLCTSHAGIIYGDAGISRRCYGLFRLLASNGGVSGGWIRFNTGCFANSNGDDV